MLEILRDGVWQFVGAILTVFSVVAAIVIYHLQKQRKEFAFGLLSVRNLLTISEELSGRVSVLFDQEPVTSIRLVVLGAKNSGDKPILASDFERQLTVTFGPGARVLSATATRQSPPNLGGEIVPVPDGFKLKPLLLNPGDYVVVQVLVSAPNLQIEHDVRVVDVAKVAPINSGTRLRPGAIKNLLINVLMFVSIGVFFFVVDHFRGSVHKDPPQAMDPWVVSSAVGFMVALMVLLTVRDWLIGLLKNHARRYIDDA